MTQAKDREIKEVVRESYAARARGADGCCSPEELDPATGASPDIYATDQLAVLPGGAIAASAGCGNPTALADLKPGEMVVDLGSGGGIDCFLAARAVGPTGRVLGIDMTPEMVQLARDNARRIKASNVAFSLGEMESLPIASDTADVVISNCVVCLSPDKESVFREAFRVLKPGGRLHVADMTLVGELPPAIRDDPQRWASCVAGAEPKEQYLRRLSNAGFVGIGLEDEAASAEPGLESLRSVRVRATKPPS